MTPSRRRTTTAAAALMAVTALAACGGNDSNAGSGAPRQSAHVAPPTPKTTAPKAPTTPKAASTGTPAPSGSTMTVAVYYISDQGNFVTLARENRQVPKSAGVVRAALDAMLHLEPLDPDYRMSIWPRKTVVRGVTIRGDLATVDLSRNAADASSGSSAEFAALEQLLWTVTAAAPKVRRVQLLFDGRKVDYIMGHGIEASTPKRPAQGHEVLAPVQILSPTHGSKVSRSLTIRGEATVFEATVSWAVVDVETKQVYAKGFETASIGAPGRGTWQVATMLPPAATGRRVQIRAWESSAKDGSVTNLDTKHVHVR